MRKNIKSSSLDYEKKIWGSQPARESLLNSYFLPLKYGLAAIKTVSGRILDLGCAAGAYTAALKQYRPDLELAGLDISQKAISIAQKRYPEIKFFQGDVARLPFKNATFEGIMANHLIEHLTDPDSVLKEVNRVLKPGGVFYSATPLENNWSTFTRWLRKIPWFEENRVSYLGHQQALDKNRFRNLLEQNGFTAKEIHWSGLLGYQIIDTLYYPFLQITGRKPFYLAQNVIPELKSVGIKIFFSLLESLINLINNLEGILFAKFPGLIIYVEAVKDE